MFKHSELNEFLIKPLQRICKYPLMLEKLVKHTPPTDPTYPNLVEGLACSSRILTAMNAAMHLRDKAKQALRLHGQVEDWKGHEISTFGQLLLTENFTVCKNDQDREYHVYLFESILLCCKEVPIPTKGKLGKSNSLLKKNKEMDTTKPATRSEPSLQLKGRIYMANITGAYFSNSIRT